MEKKIRLKLDDLAVASFTACAEEGGRGTVRANAGTFDCGETHYFPATCNTCDPLIC